MQKTKEDAVLGEPGKLLETGKKNVINHNKCNKIPERVRLFDKGKLPDKNQILVNGKHESDCDFLIDDILTRNATGGDYVIAEKLDFDKNKDQRKINNSKSKNRDFQDYQNDISEEDLDKRLNTNRSNKDKLTNAQSRALGRNSASSFFIKKQQQPNFFLEELNLSKQFMEERVSMRRSITTSVKHASGSIKCTKRPNQLDNEKPSQIGSHRNSLKGTIKRYNLNFPSQRNMQKNKSEFAEHGLLDNVNQKGISDSTMPNPSIANPENHGIMYMNITNYTNHSHH